jgi:hypothetical protein
MKKPLTLLFCLAVLYSCQKEVSTPSKNDKIISDAKNYLKSNLTDNDFSSLDFNKLVISQFDSGINLLRIGYKNKKMTENFVVLKIRNTGIENGKIIELSGNDIAIPQVNKVAKQSFNGSVSIYSIDRKAILKSDIKNGFITAFHKNSVSQPAIGAASINPRHDGTTLPEVIVVGTIHSGGGISFSNWISLMSLFNTDGGGGTGYPSGYYSDIQGGGGYAGGNGDPLPSGGGGGNEIIEAPILIDFENQYSNPAIDLNQYLKCFTDIPDAGATGSIEIFADIPVNRDPDKLFDWENGSPGHVFIKLTKTNGTQSVSQNIGFYPVSGWKTTITPAPIDGKLADNTGHEFNASCKIDLTPEQIQTAVTRMLYLNRFIKYDIDDYNCTDWALDVFNAAAPVSQRLDIPLYTIPGGEAPAGTSTPNGVYNKLKELKESGVPAAAIIGIPYLGTVGASHGPCN